MAEWSHNVEGQGGEMDIEISFLEKWLQEIHLKAKNKKQRSKEAKKTCAGEEQLQLNMNSWKSSKILSSSSKRKEQAISALQKLPTLYKPSYPSSSWPHLREPMHNGCHSWINSKQKSTIKYCVSHQVHLAKGTSWTKGQSKTQQFTLHCWGLRESKKQLQRVWETLR